MTIDRTSGKPLKRGTLVTPPLKAPGRRDSTA